MRWRKAEIAAALGKTVNWLDEWVFLRPQERREIRIWQSLQRAARRPVLVAAGDAPRRSCIATVGGAGRGRGRLPEEVRRTAERADSRCCDGGESAHSGNSPRFREATTHRASRHGGRVAVGSCAGRSIRLLQLVRVPERFVEVHEFEHRWRRWSRCCFILRRFVEQFCLAAGCVHRVVAVLIWSCALIATAPHQRELKVPSPTADVEVLFRILSTHLEN